MASPLISQVGVMPCGGFLHRFSNSQFLFVHVLCWGTTATATSRCPVRVWEIHPTTCRSTFSSTGEAPCWWRREHTCAHLDSPPTRGMNHRTFKPFLCWSGDLGLLLVLLATQGAECECDGEASVPEQNRLPQSAVRRSVPKRKNWSVDTKRVFQPNVFSCDKFRVQ